MSKFGFVFTLAVAGLMCPFQANADIIIDDFTTANPSQVALPGFEGAIFASAADPSNEATAAGGGLLGGTRDSVLEYKSGPTGVSLKIDGTGGGVSFYSEGTNDGEFSLSYDGDSDPLSLDHTGLSGFDLTEFGANDSILFEGIDNTGGTTDITGRVTVYTDAGNFSTRSFLIVDGFSGNGAISFASFVTAGGTGADFANVGAIVFQFDLNSSTGTDFSIDSITARSSRPEDGPLPTPEPSSIALFCIGAFALLGFGFMQRRKTRLAGLTA